MTPMVLPFLLLERVHYELSEGPTAQLGIELLNGVERRARDRDVLNVERNGLTVLVVLGREDPFDCRREANLAVLVVPGARLCGGVVQASDLGAYDADAHVHKLPREASEVVVEPEDEQVVTTDDLELSAELFQVRLEVQAEVLFERTDVVHVAVEVELSELLEKFPSVGLCDEQVGVHGVSS